MQTPQRRAAGEQAKSCSYCCSLAMCCSRTCARRRPASAIVYIEGQPRDQLPDYDARGQGRARTDGAAQAATIHPKADGDLELDGTPCVDLQLQGLRGHRASRRRPPRRPPAVGSPRTSRLFGSSSVGPDARHRGSAARHADRPCRHLPADVRRRPLRRRRGRDQHRRLAAKPGWKITYVVVHASRRHRRSPAAHAQPLAAWTTARPWQPATRSRGAGDLASAGRRAARST